MSIALAIPASVPSALVTQITSTTPTLTALLPPDVSIDHFQAGIWAEFLERPTLAECTEKSILKATLQAARDGMVPGKYCHFLPFKKTCTYVQNYFGVILAMNRTGRVEEVRAEPVYMNDTFRCDELGGHFEFERTFGPRGGIMCYVAWVRLVGQERPIVRPMHLEDVEKVRRCAPGGEQDAWLKWPERMGAKTALKGLDKFIQLLPQVDDDGLALLPPAEQAVVPDAQHRDNVIDLTGKEPDPIDRTPKPLPPVLEPPTADDNAWTPERIKASNAALRELIAGDNAWTSDSIWQVWHTDHPKARHVAHLPYAYLQQFFAALEEPQPEAADATDPFPEPDLSPR